MERRDAPVKGTAEYEEAKAMVKDGKSRNKDNTVEYAMDEAAHVTLSFSSYENLVAFCDLVGAKPSDRFIKGEDILKLFE